jgi:CRISPR-associated endonuclease/helicase Cas3
MVMSLPHYDEIWSHPEKQLREHLENVGEIAKYSASTIPLYFPEGTILPKIAYLIGMYHDLGKATPFFQEYIREKDPVRKLRLKNKDETKHSLISAVAAYFAVEEDLKNEGFTSEFSSFLPIASFISVRRHHTNLQAVIEDLKLESGEVLKKQVDNLYHEYLSFLPYWSIVYEKLKTLPGVWLLRKRSLVQCLKKPRGVLPYLIQHLLYSLLLDADKHQATIGNLIERKPLPTDMVENYKKTKSQKGINVIRNEIYQKVVSRVEALNLDQDHIMSLSAPTGSGKTLTALAFAIQLRDRITREKKYIPRIIYSLPFLSIIDQNAKEIQKVFKAGIGKEPTSDLFLIHHHLSDYTYREEDTEYGTDKSEILIEGWDSEIIITTFVQLFHTLFTNRNRAIRKFNKLAGSIVILDEVQSFPHKYWLLFRETAEAMGRCFNTYFILSTATQPAIFDNPRELLEEKEKYFNFLKRTQIKLNFKSPKTISEFANEFNQSLATNHKSTLVVLNTVRAAEDFLKAVRKPLEEKGYEIYYLSSNVVPRERLKRIEKIKEKSPNKKAIISTQLVEAGVDIDLERVIRDLGPIDSINQVAGRANRNLNIELGEVEVITLREQKNQQCFYSQIYDPVLIDNTRRILEPYSVVGEEDFLQLANQYYQQIRKSPFDDVSEDYLNAIRILDYEKIAKFELIEEKEQKIDIFVELDDEATDIWEQYQKILEIDNPWKRKQGFLNIRGKFYSYVISVFTRKASKNLPPEVSGIRFIPRNQLNEYYDLETGYTTKGENPFW